MHGRGPTSDESAFALTVKTCDPEREGLALITASGVIVCRRSPLGRENTQSLYPWRCMLSRSRC